MLSFIKKLLIVLLSGFILITYIPQFDYILLASNVNNSNSATNNNTSYNAGPISKFPFKIVTTINGQELPVINGQQNSKSLQTIKNGLTFSPYETVNVTMHLTRISYNSTGITNELIIKLPKVFKNAYVSSMTDGFQFEIENDTIIVKLVNNGYVDINGTNVPVLGATFKGNVTFNSEGITGTIKGNIVVNNNSIPLKINIENNIQSQSSSAGSFLAYKTVNKATLLDSESQNVSYGIHVITVGNENAGDLNILDTLQKGVILNSVNLEGYDTPAKLINGVYEKEEGNYNIEYGINAEGRYFVEIDNSSNVNSGKNIDFILNTSFKNIKNGTTVYNTAYVDGIPTNTVTTKKGFEVEATKVSSANVNDVLQGAEYNVYSANGTKITTVESGKNGIIEFSVPDSGVYYLQEIKAPIGYTINPKRISFEVDSNDIGKIINIGDLEDNLIIGSIVITKENEDGIPLAGAKIEIINSAGQVVYTGITNSKGEITDNNLPYGTYTYKEIKAPTGYTINNTIGKFKIISNKEIIHEIIKDSKITTRNSGTASSGTASSGTASSGTASSGTASSGTASSGTASSGTTNKPSATKPSTTGSTNKPETTKPSTTGSTNKPATKPSTTGSTNKPETTKPSTSGTTNKPSATKPSTTGTTNKPSATKPSTTGSTNKPVANKPSTTGSTNKPETTKPSTSGTTNKPSATKPSATKKLPDTGINSYYNMFLWIILSMILLTIGVIITIVRKEKNE